ncbi:MAG: hypothetical protein R6U93_03440 [Dehalococcoidia bacterium]
MSNEQLLAEIKSRGHWRVEMHSTEYQDERLPTRRAMQDTLNSAAVSLRGWPYPYFRAEEATYNGKWLEGQVSVGWGQKEFWQLHRSGQWINYLSLPGAWIPREILFQGRSPLPAQRPGYLHVRGHILFQLTEILRFAAGLAQGGLLDPTAFLSIQLHNTYDYMLYEDFTRPWFLAREYVNPSSTPIEQQRSIPVGQLSAVADKMALDTAIKVLEVFGWVPSEEAIRWLAEEQKKLIERRL